MNLIVVSSLSCDEGLYFRYVTMMAQQELGFQVVLESPKEDIDYYYDLLKKKGWYDFVEDFVEPEWNIDGVRIDRKLSYPKTIQVDSIRCENTLNILGQLKGFSQWER